MEHREQDPLFTAALSISRNLLRDIESENGIVDVVRQLGAFADHIVEKMVADEPALAVDCRVNCSYCCHMQVKVSPPEAFSMVQFIKDNFDAKILETLNNSIERNRELTEGKTLEERVRQKDRTPCIFLTDHACGIYPVRPLVCRAWHSLDKTGCKAACRSLDPDAEIKTTPERNYIYSMMESVLKTLCLNRKLAYGRYELPIMMDICLHSGDLLKTWWGEGDSLFENE